MVKYGKAPEFHEGDRVQLLGNHSYASDGDQGVVRSVDRHGVRDFWWVTVMFDKYPKQEPMPLFAQHLILLSRPEPTGSCSECTCSW
jgi:hypothetical protein